MTEIAKRPVIDVWAAAMHPDAICSMTEALTEGTSAEVRRYLADMGAMLQGGHPLIPSEMAWLGNALVAIGNGADANNALRLNSTRRYGPAYAKSMAFLVNDLCRQGLSKKAAMELLKHSDPRAENSLRKLLSRAGKAK